MGSLGVDALTTYGQKLIQTNQANDLDSYMWAAVTPPSRVAHYPRG